MRIALQLTKEAKRSRGQIRDLERIRNDLELVPQPAPPAFVRGHDERVVPAW